MFDDVTEYQAERALKLMGKYIRDTRKRRRRTGADTSAYFFLVGSADDEGRASPSLAQLVEFSNRSERTMKRALAWLEESGLIIVNRRRDDGTNEYLIPAAAEYDPDAAEFAEQNHEEE